MSTFGFFAVSLTKGKTWKQPVRQVLRSFGCQPLRPLQGSGRTPQTVRELTEKDLRTK